jgi:hypothetical protein
MMPIPGISLAKQDNRHRLHALKALTKPPADRLNAMMLVLDIMCLKQVKQLNYSAKLERINQCKGNLVA